MISRQTVILARQFKQHEPRIVSQFSQLELQFKSTNGFSGLFTGPQVRGSLRIRERNLGGNRLLVHERGLVVSNEYSHS